MKNFRYKLFFLLTLFILPDAVYSQFNLNYKSESKKYLSPPIDTIATKEIAFFMVIESYPIPEHSIRIIKSCNQFSIEARIFEKNFSKALSDYKLPILEGKEVTPFSIETFTYIIPISDSLKDRMLSTFSKVITYDDDSIKPKATINTNGSLSGVMLYDGPTYTFTINDKVHSQMDIQYPLDSTDFRYQVVNTIFQLINDMKNKSFDEFKYFIFN